jgi:hypothetical protein
VAGSAAAVSGAELGSGTTADERGRDTAASAPATTTASASRTTSATSAGSALGMSWVHHAVGATAIAMGVAGYWSERKNGVVEGLKGFVAFAAFTAVMIYLPAMCASGAES